jgi:hypothetical protein
MPKKQPRSLNELYPPSPACSCDVCLSYCIRPGWWTVEEASRAFEAGYAKRMMLELAPEMSFGVLSPAFRGCEASYATNAFKNQGCNFFVGGLCELHGTGFMPLECRFCHHDRRGLGPKCHADLETDWRSPAGQELVLRWSNVLRPWEKLNRFSF